MAEVEKWMLKHYTQDLDSMKCNYCQEIFSDCNRMQNFKYHLCNMHNVLELEEHPEYDNIQKNYKISSLMATCNHCKKTINLAIHGVHVLTIHLKIFHSAKSKIKILRARHKYDITGDKATCKGCKKTLKISTCAASLRRHLYDCPHFKIDFLGKKKLNKGITKKIKQKRSRVWDKYDMTGSNATCKGCKKTLKININKPNTLYNLYRHLHYCPHFKIDFPLKKEITYDITRKKSHSWDKYDITGNNSVTCKGCNKTLKVKITSIYAGTCLRQHLHYCPHFKSDFPLKKAITYEITRKKSHPWDKYDITDNNNATCKGCNKTLKVKITSIYAGTCLRQHLHYCPHFKIDFPLKKEITYEITRKKSHSWDKYDITGNNSVTCKGCNKTLKVKITSRHAGTCLRQHLHYCPHFKSDFPLKKEITYEIARKKSHPWDKYDITDNNNAICKGCNKTLKVKITSIHAESCLRQHLHYCSHFKIDFPLKKEITYEITRKKSHPRDKYDITGNNSVTCKGCNKTLKVKITSRHATSCLHQHLHYCPHFKSDFPLKKEITYEIARKKSHPWDKYDITDNNNATCKGCNKTLKVKITSIHAESCLHQHLRYCPHFKTDFPRKKEIRNQIGKKKTSRV